MSAYCKIFFLCAILFVVSQRTDGLVCYTCQGNNGTSSCNDPFNKTGIMTSASNVSGVACAKFTFLGLVSRNITTSCATTNVLGMGQWCCSYDLCNSGNKLISTSSIALALLVAGLSKFL
ncbi:unnamed protein product [Adineta steineri]|uniref:Uncharacterized protein n=1 Tax=Adineta steineri TaxID=433720 RepID=A0A814BED4_9BILA|nr:unnamed protein product [Adineta steineri]CAF0991567.1 unnamed protein product [Adineta steineri]